MLYQISNGVVSYGDNTILKAINFEIRNTEKIAIVGRNGSGKTTLLKLILGEIDLQKKSSDTDIFISKTGNPVIGCLNQMTFEDNSVTLEEEIKKVFTPILELKKKMSLLLEQLNSDNGSKDEIALSYAECEDRFSYIGGYSYERDYELIVSKFGFSEEDLKKKLSDFSGGQRTKIAFIKLLLSRPDILLLDEPTNHLDISTIAWLEGYLKTYPRAVVVVSHDRMFIDNIAEIVYEIEYGTVKRYVGNYSRFLTLKKEAYEKQLKDYEAQQKEIERLEQIVERFKNKPTKVAMTRSKLKAIEHMDKIEKPVGFDDKAFCTKLEPRLESGNDVLFVDNLGIGYDSTLTHVSLDLKKNKKVGIIGGNGLGKSTFLKTIMDMIPKKSGKYTFGYNVEIGYFDQQMAQYSSDKTIIDDIWDEYPTYTETEIRNILGGFLFRGDDVFKNVSMLSGGEKVRLVLAKMFQRRPNLLILDEPTNHMDIVGKEALETVLKQYEGTVLFVSHDRYFINSVADSLLIFENGKTWLFPYGYQEYIDKYGKEDVTVYGNQALKLNANDDGGKEKAPAKPQSEKNTYNPGKELGKAKRRLTRVEELIDTNEKELEELKAALNDSSISSDYVRLSELQNRIEQLENENEELFLEWSDLSEKLGEY